jgi:hypothetical protein
MFGINMFTKISYIGLCLTDNTRLSLILRRTQTVHILPRKPRYKFNRWYVYIYRATLYLNLLSHFDFNLFIDLQL